MAREIYMLLHLRSLRIIVTVIVLIFLASSFFIQLGLLGVFFVKTWTKFLEKSEMLKQPFTRQENTVIQTCVVATSGIAFSDWAIPILKRRKGKAGSQNVPESSWYRHS